MSKFKFKLGIPKITIKGWWNAMSTVDKISSIIVILFFIIYAIIDIYHY